ncbi:cation:proton antiporter [Candidatus Nanohalobium constans]|uniref:Kef-type K+ transport system, membrane component KefB n=1 Tax=Candidatus Nanohalobium constans TaxID=2565781 RepID=A0A5Q0UH52_9ARCH|nr:cation:proton antiporter [Candidatus Nanohalobium constans]QGA80957.1 Kef-type K+ transport system, membrane component KefB [Candidatus Nanohalobium constans]
MAAGLSGATLLNVGIVLGASFIVGELFERIGLESILGYILTGLILGPSVLDVISASSVSGFATIGATLILFQAGLREQNVKEIFSHKEGLQLGPAILLGGFAFIFAALYLFGGQYLPYSSLEAFAFIALGYSIVDIGVPSKIMLNRGMLRQETGKYTIKSSVINVSVGFIILTIMVILSTSGLQSQLVKAASILGFAGAFYLLHEFIEIIDDYIIMFEEAEAQFAITFALLLSMSYVTQTIGLSSVLGAFFAGVLVSRSDFTDSKAFQEKIQGISEGLFIPVFFAWFGLGLILETIILNIEAATVLFLLSTISKLAIGYIIPKLHEMDNPFTIAASLISLDIETLVVLLIAIDLGILTEEILQIFAPSVLFSTLTIVILYMLIDRRG